MGKSLYSFFNISRDKNKVVRWNFYFYIATFIYTILVGVVLVPLYLRYIPVEVYGYWLATGNILILVSMIDPGFSAVVQQKISFNYGCNNKERVGEYAGNGILIGFCFAFLVFILGSGIYFYFPYFLSSASSSTYIHDLQNAFGLSLIGTFFMLIYYILGAIDYGILSSIGIGLINLISNLLSLILIVFLLTNNYGILSLGLGALIRGFSFLVLSFIYTFFRFRSEDIEWKMNRGLLVDFVSLSGFNFLGKIGLNVTTQVNSYICANLVGPVAATTLKFTQTVPEFTKIIVVRLANSISPVIPNYLSIGDFSAIRNILVKLIYISIWIIGLVFLGFYTLNSLFIELWVGVEYYGGTRLNMLVLILLLFSLLSEFLSIIAFSLGNIKPNSICFFIQGCIYVPLALYCTSFFGIQGVLIAGIIGHLLTTAWYYPITIYRLLKIRIWQLKNIFIEFLKVCVIVIVGIVLFYFFVDLEKGSWLTFLLNFTLIIIYYTISLFFVSKKIRLFVAERLF